MIKPLSLSVFAALIPALGLTLGGCSPDPAMQTLLTIADAREHPAQTIDNGAPGDSAGDVLTFDQPLLNQDMQVVGNNSGICIRTLPGHSFQCQWTLTFDNGTVQVAGREMDQGTSRIAIIGGTGDYTGIHGQMTSTNNNDGTFTQVLHYRLDQD
jgi:hypothetical protein